MRERSLIDSVNRALTRAVHRQSLTGATGAFNGTVDYYYDGPDGDLWIEYKVIKSMPRSGVVIGDYTTLQLQWMERRFTNGRNLPHGPNVFGVVGLPNRTACLQRAPTEWRNGSRIETAVSIREIAEWIREFCGA